MIEPESYFTSNQLCPFVGVVEDTADPMQMGRVRVRAIGYHPEKSAGAVPTEHLPWAYVVLPTTAAGMSGIGATHGLIDGSWVFGWFLDGRDAQQPIVVGTFQGAPGFSQAQQQAINSGSAIASSAPGNLGGMFQTALASVVGGLGSPTKFGATVGSALNLIDSLKNQDFLGVVQQINGIFKQGGTQPVQQPVAKVVDAATADSLSGSSSDTFRKLVSSVPDMFTSLFKAGGATGFQQGQYNPLSSASVGTTAPAGQEVTAENSTVAVRADYDQIAGKHQDVGAILIGSTGTDKLSRYSADTIKKNEPSVSQFDYMIDHTGQVIKTGEGSEKFSVAGQPAGAIKVGLVGGAGTGTLDSKFYSVQFQTLEKLCAALVRKFPQAVIAGATALGSKAATGFDPVAWAQNKFPKNANVQDGVQKLAGTSGQEPGATTISSQNLTAGHENHTSDGSIRNVTAQERGFQGGLTHPAPSYAAKKEPDVPAMARVNGLTLGPGAGISAPLSGGPAQQYLAHLEEPSMWTYKYARKADTLEARSVPETWKVPVYQHGGEYNKTHVVRSTEAGQHIVLDDTPGREKVEVMHSSGSMLQIQADGSGVFYVKKDGYEVVLGDKKMGINGNLVISVGGDMKVQVQGDLAYDVTGKISFNGASSMHELVRGDRSTITEGSHLFQSKKNAVHRVGRDLDMSAGGKLSTNARGSRQDVTDGNRSETTRGERTSYVGGNDNSLVLGAKHEHAAHLLSQTTGEMVMAAKGNAVLSAKGKLSALAAGDAILSAGGNLSAVATGDATFDAQGTNKVIAGGGLKITGGSVDVYSSSTNKATPDWINGASAAAGVDAVAPVDVEAPPAQLTREANPADSSGNLDSEQVTKGDMDKMEATDEQGVGGQPPGSLGSSSGTRGSDDAFKPITSNEAVPAASLGNFKGDACAIANDLVAKGWTPEGASAQVGHMITESELNPLAYNPNDNGGPSGGIAQWHNSRLTALQSYSASRGLNWKSREAQVSFLDYEARTSMAGQGGNGLITASTLEEGIFAGAKFEKFVGWDSGGFTGGNWGKRAGNAAGVYNECFGKNVTSVGGQPASNVSGFTGQDQSKDGTSGTTGTGEQTPSAGEKAPYVTGGPIDWGKKVSEHFTLGQMCPTSKFHEGMNAAGPAIGSISSEQLITNLSAVAVNVCEAVLAKFGRITIMSGYRSKAYNASCGGAKNSDHMKGQAVDIIVDGVPASQVADWIEANLPVAGIGRYPRHRPPFTHVSFYIGGNRGRMRKWGG